MMMVNWNNSKTINDRNLILTDSETRQNCELKSVFKGCVTHDLTFQNLNRDL